jgi:hypothetical protein
MADDTLRADTTKRTDPMSNFSAEEIRAGVALQSIRDTYPDLDRWRARSAQVEEPQAGSELDGDARIWPGFPPHQVARVALISAVQHLNLVRTSIEAKELFPIALPTALRGALLGAARGVWLLAPDSGRDRQQRALRTIHEIHRRYLQYLESAPPRVDPDDLADAVAEISTRRDAIHQLWAPTSDLAGRQTASETEIVDSAAEATRSDPAQRDFIKNMWRTHSGDAHGLPWPMFARFSTQAMPLGRLAGYPGRMAQYSSGGDIWEVAESYGACFRLLRRGWSLFDQRSETT